MAHIADVIKELHCSVPAGVKIVAVSKFHPVEALREAYDAGQRVFGESRQQELLQKIPLMPADTVWHFIGHLQTNKVKQIVGKVNMIESVDTERLLSVIDAESAKAGVVSNVLMQVHVAKEETKFGFAPDELVAFFREKKHLNYPSVKICGVMGMASNTDDMERVKEDFRAIADVKNQIERIAPELADFHIVSMGMTHDYHEAIECGSNMVRIGTLIFGEREY